jgi:hypothetical protein
MKTIFFKKSAQKKAEVSLNAFEMNKEDLKYIQGGVLYVARRDANGDIIIGTLPKK